MRLNVLRIAILVAVTGALAGWGRMATAQEPTRTMNAYDKFRREQMTEFKKFMRGLREDGTPRDKMQEKTREYSKGMLQRLQAFRDSDEGKDYADDVNRFVIEIAFHLNEDLDTVEKVIASEKDAKKSGHLKLHAASTINANHPERARKMVNEVIEASKDKHPELYKEAKMALFRIAPQGLVFPEFPKGTKDIDGKPIKIADYKGKVVLVDFWAAWCGPCIQEAPNVVRTYKKYHSKGFEIIGISLDQTKKQMLDAAKKHGMTWRQYFDGRGWENKVSTSYGVRAIPAMYLVGKDGKVISNHVRGPNLAETIEKALASK